jgi:hypothetical protein
MLSNDNIRNINRQIASELRTVGAYMSSNEDKAAALARIAQLQSLLNPQPTRQDILAELAAALTAQTPAPTRTTAESILDILANVRR